MKFLRQLLVFPSQTSFDRVLYTNNTNLSKLLSPPCLSQRTRRNLLLCDCVVEVMLPCLSSAHLLSEDTQRRNI